MLKRLGITIIILVCLLFSACSSKEKDLMANQKESNVEQEQGNVEQEQSNVEQEQSNVDQEQGSVEQEQDNPSEQIAESEAEALQETDNLDTEQQEEGVLVFDLEEHEESLAQKADGWSNGFMFDCTWRGANVSFDQGIMTLTIDQDGENASPKWSGAEYRTKDFYHYGKYEVRMKPINNDGVVTSFFTYTGPSDNNPWDEIDIEFLGKDTTKVQFNYFTNGVGQHEYIYELGFDASEEFHEYGFEWLEDSITWYVDGVAVHTATKDIPTTPAKIMMNVWPGTGVDSWLNAFDGQVPLQAQYDWFQYTK